MTEPYLAVTKASAYIPISDELLADARETATAFDRWLTASSEERAQWAREAEQRRREERQAARPVQLTMNALLEKLGFSPAYARHLVQPYCTCGDGYDGWDYCAHARDEGLA